MDVNHSIHIESDEFRTMVTTSLDGFLIVTVTGRILDANDSYCRMMGYSREELINMHISEVDAIESPEDVSNRVEEIVKTGALRFETKHRHKNGSIIDIEVCSNYSSAHGGIFFSTSRDITELKRTREIVNTRLRLMEYSVNHSMDELLRKTLDETENLTGSCVGFYHFLDSDQEMLTLQAWSTRTATQFCKAEGSGSHYHISQAGVWVDCVRERRAVIHNDYSSLPHRKGMPEGHATVVRELVVPVFRNGNIVAILGVGNKPTDYDQRDEDMVTLLADLAFSVVEHKRIEESLRENKERLDFHVDNSPLATVEWDSDFVVTRWAGEAEKMFGWSTSETVGKPIMDLNMIYEEDIPIVQNTMKQLTDATKKYFVASNRNYTKDRKVITCEWYNTLLTNAQGKMISVLSQVLDITERKVAENALRESERLFRSLVASSSQSVWSFRPRGLSQIEQIDRANASWWCEFTGQSEMERTANDGMGWLEAVYDADREIARSNWQNILAANEPTYAEFRVYRRDGALRWMQVRGVPIQDDQGSITEIAGTVTDVTERRQAELDLQKLSSEMERLLETSATGLTRCSRDLYYLSANTAYAKLAGVPQEQIVGRPIVEVMGEEGLAAIMPYVQRVLHGERVEYETPVPFRGGVAQYLHVIYTPDVDEQGDIIGWVASVTDITERKQAEIALKEQEYELEQAQLLAKTGSWTYDPVIQKSTWSKGMFHIWGLDPALGLFPVEDHQKYIHPDDYPEFEAVLKEAVEHGVPYTMELRIKRPDGIERTIITICEPLCDSTGKVVKLRGTNQDITEIKKAEEERQLFEQQLQHTQKLESLGVLSGGIAHDFNNILAIIIGYCCLIKMDYETADKNIPEIEKAAERAAALCRQMMSYAGKAHLTLTQVNMWAMVDEMITLLKATLPQNAEIKSDLSSDLPYITADASQLRQIVMNLIINASEAIGNEQGEIRVSLDKVAVTAKESIMDYNGKIIPSGEYVCLEVTDNGCGMDEETKWRVFEPFYTTKFTGRGLGMSAVLGIINSHNGALQLFSKIGVGTTFKVFLPVPVLESGRDTISLPVTSVEWHGSGTILLVEDEDQVRLIAKMYLEMLGFTVLEAVNGREALELFIKNASNITLVVTDIGMPVMDGYKLFGELKNRNPKLPIIISSGFGDTDVISRLGSDNVAGIISKPYNANQLRDVLKRAVGGNSV